MLSHKLKLSSLVIAGAFIAACASKAPNASPIAEGADPATEVSQTEDMISQAKDRNIDVLAPKNFSKASDSLADAKKYLEKGKSPDKVLTEVSNARAYLAEAQTRGELTRSAMKDVGDARSGAIRAGAPTIFAKDFAKVDDDTRDAAATAEKGNMSKATTQGDKLAKRYHDLEVQSVTKTSLGEAQSNLAMAKKEGADKNAPKTLGIAEAKVNNALALIQANPRNTSAIARASADATEESAFLVNVARKTKAGNTEDLVLQSEKQKRVISNLATGYQSNEEELRAKDAQVKDLQAQQNVSQTADALRAKLNPNEAQVYTENGLVKVRLKGVQFGTNQASLNKKSQALLKKVDVALASIAPSKITVEGHTDSTGSEDANMKISEKRAQSVQNYLVSKANMSSDKIEAKGMGSDSPVADNKTAKGRAENRRIDLVIEPKAE
jgi:outer membrane protein OmpA-like peptidoglycan-associated protein